MAASYTRSNNMPKYQTSNKKASTKEKDNKCMVFKYSASNVNHEREIIIKPRSMTTTV
jgi:hypothetical protein